MLHHLLSSSSNSKRKNESFIEAKWKFCSNLQVGFKILKMFSSYCINQQKCKCHKLQYKEVTKNNCDLKLTRIMPSLYLLNK